MREKVHIKASHILMASVIIMIYFQIYWHYWLVKLLNGYVINTLLPIIFLFCLFLFRELVSHKTSFTERRAYSVILPLIFYAFFATISIVLNAEGFGEIKSFLIYIYSPLLIFISIVWLHKFRQNDSMKSFLLLLFIVGIIFSIYVAIIFSVDPQALLAMPTIETNRGEIKTTYGGSYGVGDLEAVRYSIPGISSTVYGPLLVPLMFVGLYFKKYTKGKLMHFIYTVLILIFRFWVKAQWIFS